jgi:hypothetical protein
MKTKEAKVLLNQGRTIYADLSNGQRHRIIGIGSKYCRSINGREINLSNIINFD